MITTKKIRVCLTREQIQLAEKILGISRFIWNSFLNYTLEMFDEYGTMKPQGEKFLAKELPKLKKDYPWLSDIPIVPLYQVINECSRSFNAYFHGRGDLPKLKTKYCNIYRKIFFTKSGVRMLSESEVVIPIFKKIELIEIGYLKQEDIENLVNIEIIKEDTDRFYISFCYKFDNIHKPRRFQTPGIAICLGIKKFATIVNTKNEVIEIPNINKITNRIKFLDSKIRKLDSAISFKRNFHIANQENINSKNLEKLYSTRRKAYRELRNIRDDFIKKLCHELVMMNPEFIVIEKMDIQNMLMVSNSNVSHDIAACKWYYFQLLLIHKCKKCGIELRISKRGIDKYKERDPKKVALKLLTMKYYIVLS